MIVTPKLTNPIQITIFAIALALPYQTHAEDGKKPELPACDPVATEKPDHHRVEDIFGCLFDHYIWDVGGSSVFLKAYRGNDSHGLMLRVCSKATELGRAEIARQRSRISGAKHSKRKMVFRGWGEPLEITND